MDQLKTFMEASSIHGIQYISTTRKYSRLFWLLVLFTGFSGAVFIIYQSFQAWNESPVKTIIETQPITEITFPKVTVCPPKNTFTDLNYDIMMAEKMTLDNKTRNELKDFTMNLLYDKLYEMTMKNLSLLEDADRYHNWYHGQTQIIEPLYYDEMWFRGLRHSIRTTAKYGSISTQYFGDRFEADKMEADTQFLFSVMVSTPKNVRNNPNVTLHFEVKRIAMKDLTGTDDLSVSEIDNLNGDITEIRKNYNPPKAYSYEVSFTREVTLEDIRRQKLHAMPGFRLNWHYSGLEEDPIGNYHDDSMTKTFVRHSSIM